MDDLISRKVMLKDLDEYMIKSEDAISVHPDDIRNYNSGLLTAIQAVTEAPSVQPEITRCKDCMWYEIYELKKDGTDDRRYKPPFCTLYDRLRDPDWFCADGVPKEKTDDR